jgi:F0F1-type ATP synthase assembly protein I
MGTTPHQTDEPERSVPSGGEDGMAVLSYILAGLIFYGGLGWAGDHFLKTSWLLPLGLILGLVSSVYLIIKRYGSGT